MRKGGAGWARVVWGAAALVVLIGTAPARSSGPGWVLQPLPGFAWGHLADTRQGVPDGGFWEDFDARDENNRPLAAPRTRERLRQASAESLFQALVAPALPQAAAFLAVLSRLHSLLVELALPLRSLPARAFSALIPSTARTSRPFAAGVFASLAPAPFLLLCVCFARRTGLSPSFPKVLRC